ncbi:unnamed protein product [Amoebophrya sp. A25]|nr:unnamed protein product [Amoebophrya sp. A25]|eukprot:GSA25T00025802001.1
MNSSSYFSRGAAGSSTKNFPRTDYGVERCFALVYVCDLAIVLLTGRELGRGGDLQDGDTDFPMRFLAAWHCVASFLTHWLLTWRDRVAACKLALLLRFVSIIACVLLMSFSVQQGSVLGGILAIIVHMLACAMLCKLLKPRDDDEDGSFWSTKLRLRDRNYNQRDREGERSARRNDHDTTSTDFDKDRRGRGPKNSINRVNNYNKSPRRGSMISRASSRGAISSRSRDKDKMNESMTSAATVGGGGGNSSSNRRKYFSGSLQGQSTTSSRNGLVQYQNVRAPSSNDTIAPLRL